MPRADAIPNALFPFGGGLLISVESGRPDARRWIRAFQSGASRVASHWFGTKWCACAAL